MKAIKYLSLFILCSLFLYGCQRPDAEFEHKDCSILNIMMKSTKDSTAPPVNGNINQETGEIEFVVPRADYNKWDLTAVKVSATLPYDAYVSPSLSGIKDLTHEDGYRITVTAKLYGKSKDYVLRARVARK